MDSNGSKELLGPTLSMSPPTMPTSLNEQSLLGVQPDKRREGRQLWKVFKAGHKLTQHLNTNQECRFCASELARADLDDKELVRGHVKCRFCGRKVRKDLRAARILFEERLKEQEGFFKSRRERMREISDLKRVAREHADMLTEQARDPLIRALSFLKRKKRGEEEQKATETYTEAVMEGRIQHYEENFTPAVPEEKPEAPVKSSWLSRHLERVRKREAEEERKQRTLRELMVADSYDTSQLGLDQDDGWDLYRDGDFDPSSRRGATIIDRKKIRRTIEAIPMLQELSLTEEEIEALVDVAVVKQIKQGEKILKKGEMMDAIVAGVGGPSKSPASQGKAEGDDNVAGAAEGETEGPAKSVFQQDEIFKGLRREDSITATKDETFVELSEGAILRLLHLGQMDDGDDGDEDETGDGTDGGGAPKKKAKLSSIVKAKRAAFLEMVAQRRQESFLSKHQPGSPIRNSNSFIRGGSHSPTAHGNPTQPDRKHTNNKFNLKHGGSLREETEEEAWGDGPFVIRSSSSHRLIHPKEMNQMKGKSGSQRMMRTPSFKLQAEFQTCGGSTPLQGWDARAFSPTTTAGQPAKGESHAAHAPHLPPTAEDDARGAPILNQQRSHSRLAPGALPRSSSNQGLPGQIAPLVSPRGDHQHGDTAQEHPSAHQTASTHSARMFVSLAHQTTPEEDRALEDHFKARKYPRQKQMDPPRIQNRLKSTAKSPPPKIFRAQNLLDDWNASLPYLQPFRGDFHGARNIAVLGKERQFQRFEVQKVIQRWSIDVPPSRQSCDEDSSSLSLSDEDGGEPEDELPKYLPSLSRAVGNPPPMRPLWSPETAVSANRAALAATPTKYMRLHRGRQRDRGRHLVGRAVHSSLEFYRPEDRDQSRSRSPSIERTESADAQERALAMEILWLARKRAEGANPGPDLGLEPGSPNQLGVFGASGPSGAQARSRARTTRTARSSMRTGPSRSQSSM